MAHFIKLCFNGGVKPFISHSLSDTETFVQTWLTQHINQYSGQKALVVGLSGDLGAGKTAFTQIVARLLGVTEVITSPTFVIEKMYELPTTKGLSSISSGFTHLIHIDAYRLESSAELVNLGWKTISNDPKNLILVEWPEKVAECIPTDALMLRFEHIDESTRAIYTQI